MTEVTTPTADASRSISRLASGASTGGVNTARDARIWIASVMTTGRTMPFKRDAAATLQARRAAGDAYDCGASGQPGRGAEQRLVEQPVG